MTEKQIAPIDPDEKERIYDEIIEGLNFQGKHEFLDMINYQVGQWRKKREQWGFNLIRNGYQASHANGGWVDMDNSIITFVYPDFFPDQYEVGNLIAIGNPDEWFSAVLTRKAESIFLIQDNKWHFEKVVDNYIVVQAGTDSSEQNGLPPYIWTMMALLVFAASCALLLSR